MTEAPAQREPPRTPAERRARWAALTLKGRRELHGTVLNAEAAVGMLLRVNRRVGDVLDAARVQAAREALLVMYDDMPDPPSHADIVAELRGHH